MNVNVRKKKWFFAFCQQSAQLLESISQNAILGTSAEKNIKHISSQQTHCNRFSRH